MVDCCQVLVSWHLRSPPIGFLVSSIVQSAFSQASIALASPECSSRARAGEMLPIAISSVTALADRTSAPRLDARTRLVIIAPRSPQIRTAGLADHINQPKILALSARSEADRPLATGVKINAYPIEQTYDFAMNRKFRWRGDAADRGNNRRASNALEALL